MPKNGSTLHPSFQLTQRVPADVNSFGPQPQIADSMGEIPFCSIVQHVGKLRAFVYRKVFLNWPSKHRRGRAKHISRYRIELAALRTSSSVAEPAFRGIRSHPNRQYIRELPLAIKALETDLQRLARSGVKGKNVLQARGASIRVEATPATQDLPS